MTLRARRRRMFSGERERSLRRVIKGRACPFRRRVAQLAVLRETCR